MWRVPLVLPRPIRAPSERARRARARLNHTELVQDPAVKRRRTVVFLAAEAHPDDRDVRVILEPGTRA